MKNEGFATAISKKMRTAWSVLFAACFMLHSLFFLSGCARMGSPDGGWYDDTPPRVLKSTPDDRGTGVTGRKVVINFDEFIKIEDAQNKVIVSPPQIEMADIKAAGKRIVVSLKDSLKENTTYTIDFSDAISDNNEGNPMGNYTFMFSTGTQIDTLQVAGYALNAENLEPVKGILVGLYPADSLTSELFHTQPMMRVSRTNGSGFYNIKGVAPGRYNVFALQDADGDFVYGQKSEMIGFSHVVIEPSVTRATRQDTVWTDSLHISTIKRIDYDRFLPDDMTLLCFQAPQTDRYLVKTERKEPEKIGFYFSYGSDSLPRLRGLNFEADSAFVVEPSEHRDTVVYWLRDTTLVNQDTLRIEATYLSTDSTGLLYEKTDTIEAMPKVPYAKRMKEKEKEYEKWKKEQDKKKKHDEPYDSVMPRQALQVKLSVGGSMAPNQNIVLQMPEPLAACDTAGIHLYSKIDTLWYESPHQFEQLSTRAYLLRGEWRPGVEYSFEVDSAAFRGIYGLVSNPIKQGIKISTDDEFSTLQMNIVGLPDSSAIVVQLLDGSDKVVRSTVADGGTADFFYVRPSKYYVRAFVDTNGNGIWDTGNYDEDLQAEPLYYFHEQIECKAKWDVVRRWDVNERPRYRQKPLAITKQKPDKEKQQRNRNAQRAADKGIPYVPKE
jgi:uncharacterized protein (DUF2141 family)